MPDPQVWLGRAAEYRDWADKASGEAARQKWLKLAQACEEMARRIMAEHDVTPAKSRRLSGRR